MTDKRKVKFNMAIIDYYAGEIVNYTDMPETHQFWVDHKSISGGIPICEFVEVSEIVPESLVKLTEKEFMAELDDFKEAYVEPEKESKINVSLSDDIQTKDYGFNNFTGSTESETTESKKVPSFDFDIEDKKPLCPGKNKDGSSCGRDKLKANGYCFQHQSQAPTGLTGEMPENMRAIQGST